MLSPDSTISLAVGLGGLLVTIVGTAIGYLTLKATHSSSSQCKSLLSILILPILILSDIESLPFHANSEMAIASSYGLPAVPPKAYMTWPREIGHLDLPPAYPDRHRSRTYN